VCGRVGVDLINVEEPQLGNPRILLCVPHGGLNDTLCQIEKCREYALSYGRDLYLDTRRSGLMADFDTFFELDRSPGLNCITRVDDKTFVKLNMLSAFPSEVQGKIGGYLNIYCQKTHLQIEAASKSVLTFDFARDYSEDLLVHEQHGGGLRSANLMRQLKLSAMARAYISERLAPLPVRYDAVHIRHTDYKTDYVKFLLELRGVVAQKYVVICSDNAEVIAEARSILSNSNVLTVTQLPDLHGKPLHQFRSYKFENERIEATLRSLADLLALAMSERFHFTNVERGYASGFSRLASFLHENKFVVRSLLGVMDLASEP
jgi:hypothetical protein